MKRTQNYNTPNLSAICVGCRFAAIASGKEFICNRADMGSIEVATSVVDAFFGERCKGYEPHDDN